MPSPSGPVRVAMSLSRQDQPAQRGPRTVAAVLFVVFEKHLSNTYGTWRLHAKIVPEWLPAREPGRLTYRVPEEKDEEEVTKEKEEDKKDEEEEEGGIFDKF